MNYLKEMENTIRNKWFKNHVAHVEGKDGLQIFYWAEPESPYYYVEYVLSKNNVFISGDVGEAAYTLTCPATLENIEDFNLSYFTSKLSAFCDDRWNFDQKLAEEELKEYWKEYDMHEFEGYQKLYDDILSAISDSHSVDVFEGRLISVYQDSCIDSGTMDVISNFGQRLPPRLIAYWVGLQMIIEELKGEKRK